MSRVVPILALVVLLATASGALASESSPTPGAPARSASSTLAQAGSPTYADVAPIFAKQCVMCHSGAQPAGGLRLDSHANILKGTPKERVVIPGSPQKSDLLLRIKGTRTPRMPMNGPPWVTDADTTLIEKWIGAGAPDSSKARVEPAEPSTMSAEGAARPPGGAFTYADVAPVFNGRCVKCHTSRGVMGAPPEGIRLDSLANVLQSSERAVVVPGVPLASSVVRAVNGMSRPRMPRGGPPWLSDDEVQRIATWIEQGARDDGGNPSPVPMGKRVRLGGHLTDRWKLDGLPLLVDRSTRIDKNPRPGDYVEVRGIVTDGGLIQAHRIRAR